MEVYVGVDWSATELVCAAAAGDDSPRRLGPATRTFSSVKDLIARVRHRHPGHDVHVVIEAGSPGWTRLLHEAGAVVRVVDARMAKAFATTWSMSGAKDDMRDAMALVELGRSRHHRLEVWTPPSADEARLHALASEHESLMKQRIACQQRLRGLLRETFPELEAHLGNLTKRWVHRLLEIAPTPWHAHQLTWDQFRAFMSGSYARRKRVEQLFEVFQAAPAPWLDRDSALATAGEIGRKTAQLAQLRDQLADVDKQLDQVLDAMGLCPTLTSVKGISTHMAVRLIDFAFARTPKHRDAAAIVMGAAPVFVGSGKTRAGRSKGYAAMRRAAPPRARATTYLLGRLASQHLVWARAMYADGRSRGQSAATAYRRIARSLLRILTAMVRTGQPYDEARYVAALQSKGVPWAQGLTVNAA